MVALTVNFDPSVKVISTRCSEQCSQLQIANTFQAAVPAGMGTLYSPVHDWGMSSRIEGNRSILFDLPERSK